MGWAVSSPFFTVGLAAVFGALGGMMTGGLVSMRPDRALLDTKVEAAVQEGRWAVVVHPVNHGEEERALEVLEHSNGEVVPPNLKKDVPRLHAFLELLPPQSRAAFEFRHASWFDDEVFALLHAHQAALCIAEAEGELDVPVVATADWGYLRLRRQTMAIRNCRRGPQRVRQQHWQDAFVFFKHEEAGRGPQLAQRFIELAA